MEDCKKTSREVTQSINTRLMKQLENDNIQELLKLLGGYGKPKGLNIPSPEINDVNMALKVMYDDYVAGYYVDNPHARGYQPFKRTKVPDNSNVIVIKIRNISAVIDCYTSPGKILWRQPGREDVIMDLRHLLYRVSKLSVGEATKNLIDCILIGTKIHKQLSEEISDYFTIDDISTPGISVVQVPIQSVTDNTKYNVSIQFSKITVWNKKLDKCILETNKPEEVIDSLLIEALNNVK